MIRLYIYIYLQFLSAITIIIIEPLYYVVAFVQQCDDVIILACN